MRPQAVDDRAPVAGAAHRGLDPRGELRPRCGCARAPARARRRPRPAGAPAAAGRCARRRARRGRRARPRSGRAPRRSSSGRCRRRARGGRRRAARAATSRRDRRRSGDGRAARVRPLTCATGSPRPERDRRPDGVGRAAAATDAVVDVLPGFEPVARLLLRLGRRLRVRRRRRCSRSGLAAPDAPASGSPPRCTTIPATSPIPATGRSSSGSPGACRVLVVGTGLTMIDVALALSAGEHGGPDVLAVSRTGLLPRAHRPVAGVAGPAPASGASAARTQSPRGSSPRCAAPATGARSSTACGLITQALWRCLAAVLSRRRFAERHGRRWDVHRHRMAPEIAARRGWLRASGALRRARGVGGRLASSLAEARSRRALRGRLRRAARRRRRARQRDRVRRYDVPPLGRPLAVACAALGAASRRPGPLGLGLRTDAGGALLDARRPALRPHLLTLGALRRGELWETTAVPEIRAQAATIAAALARRTERVLVSA